jgi:hypothetical protein
MKTLGLYGRTFEIHTQSGKVVGQSSSTTTQVSGGGSNYAGDRVNPVRSSTTVRNDIFLADRDGKEHHYSLTNFNVACREGHELSVLWAIRQGKQNGPYFLVVNHTTSEQFWSSDASLFKAFFQKWYHSPIFIIPTVLFMFLLFPFFCFSFGIGIFLALIMGGVLFVIMLRTGYGRMNRLKADFKPQEYIAS